LFNRYKRADYWGLQSAAQIGNLELVEFYMSRLQYKTVKRQICLDRGLLGSIRGGNIDLVKYFLNLGANNYTKAFAEALCHKNISVASILVKYDIN
jgi:hypothetical protein